MAAFISTDRLKDMNNFEEKSKITFTKNKRNINKSLRHPILSHKSHISVLCASRPFRKYIVYDTIPGIEFTILYNGDNLSAM